MHGSRARSGGELVGEHRVTAGDFETIFTAGMFDDDNVGYVRVGAVFDFSVKWDSESKV